MSTISKSLKPFVINNTDIQFLIDQVNFRPLFDATGNVIVAWDGTGPVFDFFGNRYADQGSAAANLAKWGQSYQNFTDLSGTRDVSGFWNNLTPELRHYGDTGFAFPRMIDASYSNYLKQSTALSPTVRPVAADLAGVTATTSTSSTSTDSMHVPGSVAVMPQNSPGYSVSYEIWQRTVVGEVASTKFVDGHHVFVNLSQTTTTTTTQVNSMILDGSGEHVISYGTPSSTGAVTGEVVMSGGELDGMYHRFTTAVPKSDSAGQTQYALDHQDYTVKAGHVGSVAFGDTASSNGMDININNVVDYTPRMISRTVTTAGVTYDTWANHAAENAALPADQQHQAGEIYYGATGEAQVLDWGKLETVANGGEGQIDTQARLSWFGRPRRSLHRQPQPRRRRPPTASSCCSASSSIMAWTSSTRASWTATATT